MTTHDEQIAAIEKEIRETPYHKGTEHHIGMLRARISRLKDHLYASEKSGGGGGGGGYAVKKHGDASVVLVGPPSAGKSTLINLLTNANSKVAAYAFTTVSVIPGMMDYNGARIQIFDVPGLIEGAGGGKGRGKEVLSVVRASDLIILMVDKPRLHFFEALESELYRAGVRINTAEPKVRIEKKLSGGIVIRSSFRQDIEEDTIRAIAKEYRLTNAEIVISEKLTVDKAIDAFSTSRVYVPAIYVVNKQERLDTSLGKYLQISALTGFGTQELKKILWDRLGLVKIYLIEEGEDPSQNHPFIVHSHMSLMDVVDKLGSTKAQMVKSARIWGAGAKFTGQTASLTTQVVEGMQIQFLF